MPSTTVALSPAQSAEWEKAIRVILCDCGCHPQSVKECACGRAATMRDEIAAAVAGGRSGEQVIADYVARYGEKILIAPTGGGFNLVAWLAPGFGFLAAAITLAVVLRRWRSGTTPPLAGAPPAPAGDDPYARALERELETYDR